MLLLCVVASWVALGATYYFHLWLIDNLWPWSLAYPALWLLAVSLTTFWVLRLRRRERQGWALVAVACQIAVGVAVAGVLPWERVFRQTWFEIHRTAFAELARTGDDLPEGFSALPGRYRKLTLGRGAVERSEDVLFLTVAEMKPERIGFTRVLGKRAGADPCTRLNEIDDVQYTCAPLDDGWWWTGDNWPIER
ncbi:hypothetical protein EDD27_3936 [Nonomuraea polychroma]|uniref:Uncharacterized protein n=1 Tax=Nonomuraea polychroma TaxID=46176 RepID=A0A438M6U0_9ACTN|nr:hypothetical protein [Nonomuraea polychroma]RVX41407.1 hypothetical protein EDD27_3936 [Nonomuraea polychroma]